MRVTGRTPWGAVDQALLGTEPAVRTRVCRMLKLAPVYGACIALTQYGVAQGVLTVGRGAALALYLLLGYVAVIAMLRMGRSVRRGDFDLGLERAWLATGALVAGYAWVPTLDARSDVLLLFALVLVLSLFSLTARQMRLWGWVTVGLLGACAGWDALFYLTGRDRAYELLQFGVVACCLPATSAVARGVRHLRDKLERQERELQEALAHVQRLAQCDILTGVINRRHMHEVLERELARQARGQGSPCTLAILDLDHFKRVNDGFGHGVGDQVLQGVVRTLQPLLRGGDVLARWGGEEFLLLFPRTSAPQARGALHRLQTALREAHVAADAPQLRITTSVGLAEHAAGETLDALLERADRALYRAKAGGRDRIELADPPRQRAAG